MSSSEGNEDDSKSTGTDIDTPISCFWCDRESCWRLWRSFNRYWKLAVACAAVFLYVLLGGILFSAAERPSELRRIEESEVVREQAISDLFNMLLNSTNVTEEEARNLTVALLALGRTAAEAARNLSFDANPIWDFSSAIFFSSTVITTIGTMAFDVCLYTKLMYTNKQTHDLGHQYMVVALHLGGVVAICQHFFSLQGMAA